MSDDRELDIEMLARLAARLAGRDPDERHTIELGGFVAFDDVAWRYPDFVARAETAYTLLGQPDLLRASELRRQDGGPPTRIDRNGVHRDLDASEN